MSWLDKLLGREKKDAGSMTGDSSMTRESTPKEGMASEPGQMGQEERAGESQSQGSDSP
ncbi:MAG: hypothetical protein WBB76_08575 [Gaiellaceae bacterium]